MLIYIAIIGIVLNFIALSGEIKKSPEGAMGMGPMFILCLVPYLFSSMWVWEKFGHE